MAVGPSNQKVTLLSHPLHCNIIDSITIPWVAGVSREAQRADSVSVKGNLQSSFLPLPIYSLLKKFENQKAQWGISIFFDKALSPIRLYYWPSLITQRYE